MTLRHVVGQGKGIATSEEELTELAGRWGRVTQARLRDGRAGLWLAQFGLIILDERLSDVQRRCVLAHEISHAKHGDTACAHTGAMEARADREAACMLISLDAYKRAERIYEDNSFLIARELHVTQWLVRAFQSYLRDSGQRIYINDYNFASSVIF